MQNHTVTVGVKGTQNVVFIHRIERVIKTREAVPITEKKDLEDAQEHDGACTCHDEYMVEHIADYATNKIVTKYLVWLYECSPARSALKVAGAPSQPIFWLYCKRQARHRCKTTWKSVENEGDGKEAR